MSVSFSLLLSMNEKDGTAPSPSFNTPQLCLNSGIDNFQQLGELTPLQEFLSREAMADFYAKYSWGSGGTVSPQVDPVQSPGGGAGGETLEASKILHFTLPKMV